MRPWLEGLAANPSSTHAAGRAARRAVEAARAEVAAILGAEPDEIVFTSGGTEANVLAVRGGARAARDTDSARTRVFFTAAEHSAVREAALSLGADGFEVVPLPVNSRGAPSDEAIDPEATDVALVAAILANNETGAVFHDLPAFAGRARAAGALLHTDAVQAAGKIPVNVRDLGVDLLALSAHKFGGPKGAGALFVRKGVRLQAVAAGGGQERGRRGGTENVAGIVGLAAALGFASSRLASESIRLAALRDAFETGILSRVPDTRVNAVDGRRVAGATSIVFAGTEAEVLAAALDLEGIAVSAGSACHAGTTTPSAVLLALGLTPSEARATLRISFGHSSTREDVACLLETLPRVVARAREAIRP